MRLEHPIFTGPLDPQLQLTEIDTPAHYADWAPHEQLPARLPVWVVQQGKLGDEVDYGLVSTPYGFEDSPDAEWISSGNNSKGPTSLALGRHANLFLWGFAGDPTQMTPSARRVFLNTVVYMKQFDGQVPLIRREGNRDPGQAREWALVYVGLMRAYGKDPQTKEHMLSMFSAEARAACGDDPAKLLAYHQENLEYLRGGEGGTVSVDAEVKALGVSNRKPEFLDRLAALLREKGAADPTVAALFDRYLPAEAPREPAAFADWLSRNRERLFFSDRYGYRWFVGPRPSVPSAPQTRPH